MLNHCSQGKCRASFLLAFGYIIMGFQVAQWVKNLPAVQETQETWVQFLGQEDPPEEGTATHSSILAWRIPGTKGARWAAVHDHKESDTAEHTCNLVLWVFLF